MKGFVVGYETREMETHGFLPCYSLGETYPPGAHAIDEHTHGGIRAEIGVVDKLNEHPLDPHRERRPGQSEEYNPRCQMGQRLRWNLIDKVVEPEAHYERERHSRSEPAQVRECRESQDSGISPEKLEEYCADEDIDHYNPKQRPEVPLQGGTPVKSPIGNHKREENDQAIKGKHAPVR